MSLSHLDENNRPKMGWIVSEKKVTFRRKGKQAKWEVIKEVKKGRLSKACRKRNIYQIRGLVYYRNRVGSFGIPISKGRLRKKNFLGNFGFPKLVGSNPFLFL